MYVLGLTGPLASGKSAVAQMFRDVGAEVWDADVAVKRLYKPGKPVTLALAETLGEGILDKDGGVDVKGLIEKIRKDSGVLGVVESVVFPALVPAWYGWVKRRKSPLLVLEAPLLFEAKLEKFCNAVAVCSAPEGVRKERALARENVDEVWWEVMTSRQMSTEDYISRGDLVVECGGEFDVPKAFVSDMWARYGSV